MALIDLRNDPNNPSNIASAGIIKIINAAADAKQSQTELQKQVMLHQIQSKQELQDNATKLQQGNQAQVDLQKMKLDAFSSPDSSAPANTGGMANSQTANNIPGNPAAPVPSLDAMSAPSQPPMSMADPSQQPANDAAQMPQQAQSTDQPPQQQPQTPQAAPVPAGVNIPSPIGRPLPPPQGRVIIGQDGKPTLNPNYGTPDSQTYSGLYNKWASGQPLSDGENKWLQDKSGMDASGNPINNTQSNQAPLTKFQQAVSNVKKSYGAQYTIDPKSMDVIDDPLYMSMMKAKQDVMAREPDRQEARQDKLYNQAVTDIANKQISYRSGSIGLQDAKVSQAIHARQLINQAYDPKTGQYDVTQVPYGELSESLGSLLSGGTGSSEGRINALKQKTASGDLNGAMTYITGKPSNAAPQDVLKQLVGMIDRQGKTAEDIRDGDVKRLKHAVLDGSGLDNDRKQAMINSPSIGASYRELLSGSSDQSKSVNASGQYQEGQTANNPKTGQVLTYRNGQWQ